MKKPLKLKAYIKLEKEGVMIARSSLYDGTEFSIGVREHEVSLNEKLKKVGQEVTGFILVHQNALQENKSYIELPQPTITHGHNIIVSKYSLQPMDCSIKDFKHEIK